MCGIWLLNATNFEQISFLPQFQEKFGSGSQYYPYVFGDAQYDPSAANRMKENWRSYENQQYGDAYDGSMRIAGRTLSDGSKLPNGTKVVIFALV